MGAIETTEYRRRRKDNLIQVCGGKCVLCGYNKLSAALEFHHLDPAQKKYGIGGGGVCHNLEDDLAEVQKCLLVCANCHREIHADLYSIDTLRAKQIYLADVAQFLLEDKQNRVGKKEHICTACGKSITKYSSSGLCSICAREHQRKVERPDRETLKNLIRSTPFTKIGAMFGVSDSAIRKWCKNMNLPSKSGEIKAYTDEEWALI